MSFIAEKLRIIPRPAWIVGCVLTVALALPLWLGPMRLDPQMRSWPLLAKVGFIAVVPLCIMAYSLLVGFIYADAKRRQMRHVMWTWLALVPYFVGVIVYFIMRDPLPTPCPKCGSEVPKAFAFCPECGTAVHPTCSQCGKLLRHEWANCPYCGAVVLSSRAGSDN
jgi:RNA polymerase subunit RPABC4/transcription elongation factor Spt4